ncbi:hypothetical protein LTS08_007598 [Lithohypha guttulata]|uniref:Uncharacterized protein n=1 Tax=Lithohypha guttulata TaxID=1690604 RepID=A0AAN7T780_9EURO|nr:hypothetical protein LTR51_008393 [Lithohypha guttulata]KAK5091719.1 hypothetical protein LTR05_001904 [Lithohypha guttulata]KAK5096342.1 hypothetical protein LTS08_007598 [Lithohypha guttulata]
MDIRKDQFAVEAVRLLQDIADSHFISFDFEFSGIAERDRNRATKQTVQERYEETRISVQEYQPLQIGLTIVKYDDKKKRYVLEPYNLNISPLPLLRERQFTRKWSMNSGAVSFLHRNGFDFGRQLIHGVPYLSSQEEEKARTKMTADAKREDLVLKADDQALAQHVRSAIEKWQSQPKEQQEEWLNIPHDQPADMPAELNSYQRRLVHQIVQNEFPGLKTQGMNTFVQITSPGPEKQISLKQLEEEYRERDLSRAIGFRWIVDGMTGKDLSNLPHDYLLPALPKTVSAEEGERPVKAFLTALNRRLQERRKVLIGHNCLTDIMFLYKMTIGDLPETLQEFKDKVHELFPAIIDTKFISSCYSEKHGRLSLGEVAEDLNIDQSIHPELYTSGEFDRYINSTWLHEAGYDSYITAIVAIKMAAKLQRDGSSRKKDHDRQAEEVANRVADHPPEFGLQEGQAPSTGTEPREATRHVTAAPEPQSKPFGYSSLTSIASTLSNISSAITGRSSNNKSSNDLEPAASESASASTKPVDWKNESQVAGLRPLFSSTSIYDNLDSSNSTMPGDEPSKAQIETENREQVMEKLVKEGKLMPRWHEERAFWDFYGNKLQVNGTQEGIIRLGD